MTPLPPYPAYKDSGVPWLGRIPAHWDATMTKRHYSIQLGKMLQNTPKSNDDKSIPYLKAQHVQWFAVRSHGLPHMWASPVEIEGYGVQVGDLLVCEGGEGGRSGLVKSIGGPAIIQNALHRVRPSSFCRNDFLQYVMSTVSAIGWFDALNNKATIAHFTYEKFGALGIPIPPPHEQRAITRYLDHVDRRIRRTIRARQKLIALLEEQKQAVIHLAVTGQIDVRTGRPYPVYKPSGVEWLGEAPEHWDVAALRHRYSSELGKMLDAKRITGDHLLPYVRNIDVQWDRVNTVGLAQMDIASEEYARYTLDQGDLLVCEGGEVGRCAIWSGEIPLCGYQKAIHRVRSLDRSRDNARHLLYVMRAGARIGVFLADGSENTIAHLTGVKLRRHRFAFPPKHEQDAIVT